MKLASFPPKLSSPVSLHGSCSQCGVRTGVPARDTGEKKPCVCDCATLSNGESKAGEKSEVEEQAGGETRE